MAELPKVGDVGIATYHSCTFRARVTTIVSGPKGPGLVVTAVEMQDWRLLGASSVVVEPADFERQKDLVAQHVTDRRAAGARRGVLQDDLDQALTRAEAAEAEVRELRAENVRLRGIRPALPQRPARRRGRETPPDGGGLQRYGIRWNGPTQALSVPMDDGYWTPWYLAAEAVQAAEADLRKLRAEVEALRYERDEARSAVATVVALIAGSDGGVPASSADVRELCDNLSYKWRMEECAKKAAKEAGRG